MERAEKQHKKNKMKIVKKQENIPVWFNEKNDSQDITDNEKQELENLLKDFR